MKTNRKMDKIVEKACHKRKDPNGQYVCETVLNFISH